MVKNKERTNQFNACRALSRTLREHELFTIQVEKKLLPELGGVMPIIMSNSDKLEICPFDKFIWGRHHHLAFAVVVRLIH